MRLCQQPRRTTTAAPANPVATKPKGQVQLNFFLLSLTCHNL